jgi:hypothetical protein
MRALRGSLACVLLLGASAACGPGGTSNGAAHPRSAASAAAPQAAPAKAARERRCEYHVAVTSPAPLELRVDVRCDGGNVTGFVPTEPSLRAFVRGAPGNGPIPAQKTAPDTAELHYSFDLEGLAQVARDHDIAERYGHSLVAPASSFLLAPEPPEDGTPLRVHFDSPDVESGLKRAADGAYLLDSHELKVATYTTFGARETRDITLGDATVRLAVLDGKLDLATGVLERWVLEAARGVAAFYRRPPEPRTLVVLVPVPDRHGVPFGKMLPESGPGVIVFVGEHTAADELHADWVLVHELFHAGTPSYLGEGKWYDEGLATYFEPLIRTRLGWRTEADLWAEFLRDMPRGLDALTRRGLANPVGYSDIYWGGGLLCLLADLELRRTTSGAKGLEDGVRAVLAAGGYSSEVWTLARATEVTDAALGTPLLARLQSEHLERGTPVDLDAVFRELGVSIGKNGGIALDPHPPAAALRHALVYGSTP